MKTITSTSPEETEQIARRLAPALQKGMIVCLIGELGAGKSVIARAIADELGVSDPMPSPTFTLVNEYHSRRGLPVLHVDLYRLADEREFDLLGLDSVMKGAITIVEWPERSPDLLAEARLTVTITIGPGFSGRSMRIDWNDANPGN